MPVLAYLTLSGNARPEGNETLVVEFFTYQVPCTPIPRLVSVR